MMRFASFNESYDRRSSGSVCPPRVPPAAPPRSSGVKSKPAGRPAAKEMVPPISDGPVLPTLRKKKRRNNPLGSQSGIIGEMTRLYRKVKAGKLDAHEGRSHVWMLERIGLRLEALALERIEANLQNLADAQAAQTERLYGQQSTDRQLIAAH